MSFWNKFRSLFSPPASKTDASLRQLEHRIGYIFHDRQLLLSSLTHRSHANTVDTAQPSYERLEFLGDSVLGLVVAEQLYRDHPGIMEGDLTKIKALLVSEATLSIIGREMGINNHLILSADEERAGGKERSSIISDALEAIIGAVYLDGGLAEARKIILNFIYIKKEDVTSDATRRNYKGELLEYVQSRGEGMPRYDVVAEVGPDHDKVFTVSVSILGRQVGIGSGSSKKEAEQRAAASALQSTLGNEQLNTDS
jgi:ribonuclease-3